MKSAGVRLRRRSGHITAAPQPTLMYSSACMMALGELARLQPLEHAKRRTCRFAHRVHVEPECLLEGVLPFECAVQHIVGEQHPRGAGWKLHDLARRVLLI